MASTIKQATIVVTASFFCSVERYIYAHSNSQFEANGPLEEGFIGVVDTDGKICSVKFKTKDRWTQGRYLNGQADLNGDGFSDVFLINYGDYGAFDIFAERNGIWIRIHNHGPQTC